MTPVITKSLQDILVIHPEHKKVYFDASGRHYFYAFQLHENYKGNKGVFEPVGDKKLFGTGKFSHKQIIPGILNVDKKTEDICKGDSDSLIVLTMTREEVLKSVPKYEGDSIVAGVASMSDADKSVLLKALGIDVELLKSIKSLQVTEEAPQEVTKKTK